MNRQVDWTPLGLNYRIRITLPETQTKGGIFLPEGDVWNCNDGMVIGIGLGKTYFLPNRYKFQARVGERVLFERMDMEPGINEMEGVVSDDDIVGILTSKRGYGVDPCGEWLLVSGGRQEETKSGLAIPEHYQNRLRSGLVLNYGPGRLVKRGPREGLRLTCGELLGEEPFGDVRGLVVHWGKNANLLYSPGQEGWLMCRCCDIICLCLGGSVAAGGSA